MATNFIESINGTTSTAELQTAKLEFVLLASQANKANLLEGLLKDQMLALQGKNDQLAAYNTLMANLNGILGRFAKDAAPTTGVPNISESDNYNLVVAMSNAGVAFDSLFNKPFNVQSNYYPLNFLNKSQIEAAVTQIKSTIDNLSNTQQLDMLRIQSLSNKRNEAFEMLTTFIKKFTDMMNNIIRNMN